MRLTNNLRDAFIRAVMSDVPEIDYDSQATDLLVAHAVELLPPKVRAVWEDTKTRDYVNKEYIWIEGFTVYFPGLDRGELEARMTAEFKAKLKKLARLDREQREARLTLEKRLAGVVASVTTTKALRTALPEFEKYLPPEEEKTANLPAIANVVTDFIKAGWPKGKTA